jgi:hypothetical protein
MEYVRQIIAFSPRQLEGEARTAAFIVDFLRSRGVKAAKEPFTTTIPVYDRAELVADGKKIPCEGCCFESGVIDGKDVIVSASMPSVYFQDKPNISFNPSCPVISCGNHYYAPAVAVSHDGLQRVLKAKRVRAEVSVRLMKHRSMNILAGKMDDPATVCIAHYDSVKTGALDNASGVAVLMDLITRRPKLLDRSLFVFSGAEEISTDKPHYWGRGFRMLQRRHPRLFSRAQRILVVDCVGNGPTNEATDPTLLCRAFPIHDFKKYQEKITMFYGDIDHLMTVYHSELDDGRSMSSKWLRQAADLVASHIV